VLGQSLSCCGRPLLKEERSVVLAARGVDIFYPIAVHRPCLGGGLPADVSEGVAAKPGNDF
jgi:hypothetical protein